MKQIILKKIKIENFLSVGSNALELPLDNNVNIITGRNYDKEDSKNGVGKSTITDAVHFALYGTPLRDISKEQTVNHTTGKNCKVELSFVVKTECTQDEYVIVRSISPTKCSIYKNKENVTLSTMAKSTEYLQDLINCSSKVFQNSVVMSINNTVPFMAQSKVDKRKYIENMLQLEVFSQMLLRAREDYNELKHGYDLARSKHTNNLNMFANIEKQINIFDIEKQDSIAKIELSLDEKNKTLVELEGSLSKLSKTSVTVQDFTEDIKKIEDKCVKLNAKRKELIEKKTQTLTEKKILKEQLKQLLDSTKPCPTCKRAFDVDSNCDHLTENLKTQINNIDETAFNGKLEELDELHDKLRAGLKSIEAKQNDNRNSVSAFQRAEVVLTTKIENVKEYITDLELSLKQKQSDTNTLLNEQKEQIQKDINLSEIDVNNIESELKILDCVKYVLSEEGVKSFLIKKILKVLNSKINFYLSHLQAPVKCEFNEFFEECITDEKKNECSYFNFSGGERKRIDLACLFAFMDMKRLQGETVFNTTFYDELLDSSLDDRGVELVLDLLVQRNKDFGEGSYIITHRGQSLLNRVDKIINLEKRNGATYLLQDI